MSPECASYDNMSLNILIPLAFSCPLASLARASYKGGTYAWLVEGEEDEGQQTVGLGSLFWAIPQGLPFVCPQEVTRTLGEYHFPLGHQNKL